MRLIVDSLIAAMLAAILVVVIFNHRQAEQALQRERTVHLALASLHEQATLRGAMAQAIEGDEAMRFPPAISPTWFTTLPMNAMLPGRHPWLDIAPPGDQTDQPPDPIAYRITQAGFWYNPNRGIFRARVQAALTEAETLDLYNRLNGTSLKVLPTANTDDTRKPQAHDLTRLLDSATADAYTKPTLKTLADPAHLTPP